MFKIVIIVSNIMGPRAKPSNLIKAYSITPELDIISIGMHVVGESWGSAPPSLKNLQHPKAKKFDTTSLFKKYRKGFSYKINCEFAAK